MIVDAHVHLVRDADDLLPDIGGIHAADDVIRMMERFGMGAAIVFGNPFYYDPQPENDRVASEAAKYPDRLLPVGLVNPRLGEASVSEIRRCIEQLGFRGIKIRPDSYACPANAPVMRPLIEETRRLGVPLLIHSGRTHWSHPLTIGDLVRDYPDAVVVMQHMFDLSGKHAIRVARACPNLLVETSSCLGAPFIREMVEAIGSERVMFGSDSPALSTHIELLKVKRAGLSVADEGNVLFRTAARLWKIDLGETG